MRWATPVGKTLQFYVDVSSLVGLPAIDIGVRGHSSLHFDMAVGFAWLN